MPDCPAPARLARGYYLYLFALQFELNHAAVLQRSPYHLGQPPFPLFCGQSVFNRQYTLHSFLQLTHSCCLFSLFFLWIDFLRALALNHNWLEFVVFVCASPQAPILPKCIGTSCPARSLRLRDGSFLISADGADAACGAACCGCVRDKTALSHHPHGEGCAGSGRKAPSDEAALS